MNKELQEKQDRLILNSIWDAIVRIEDKIDDLSYTVEGLGSQEAPERPETPELIQGVKEALDDLCNIK